MRSSGSKINQLKKGLDLYNPDLFNAKSAYPD